jgi:hypothetical protein
MAPINSQGYPSPKLSQANSLFSSSLSAHQIYSRQLARENLKPWMGSSSIGDPAVLMARQARSYLHVSRPRHTDRRVKCGIQQPYGHTKVASCHFDNDDNIITTFTTNPHLCQSIRNGGTCPRGHSVPRCHSRCQGCNRCKGTRHTSQSVPSSASGHENFGKPSPYEYKAVVTGRHCIMSVYRST